jgi:hypothetical protein
MLDETVVGLDGVPVELTFESGSGVFGVNPPHASKVINKTARTIGIFLFIVYILQQIVEMQKKLVFGVEVKQIDRVSPDD